MTYEEQLLTPEWRSKRQEIIDRDWGMCQHCMSTKNLQVHHKRYIEGRMAWEYDGWDSYLLITLCSKCHAAVHGIDVTEYKTSPEWRKYERVAIYNSKPVKHISDVILEWINKFTDAKEIY